MQVRRLTWVLIGAGGGALLLLLVAASPLPSLVARAWAVSGAPTKADAIVVLGGGSAWPGVLLCSSLMRLQHGVWLYHEGYVPRLIVSGGAAPRDGAIPSEAELMRQMALAMGVQPGDIVVEDRSSRTYENGREVAAIMRREGWRSALLVTDAVHMRRARLVFQRLGILAYPAPSHTPSVQASTPGRGFALLEQVGYEMIATAIYKLRGWL